MQIVPVLAGGGTRLPVHVGVLSALAEMEIGYRHIVGVSGGSIIAALVASGMNVDVMHQLFLKMNFSIFRGQSLFNLLLHGGLSDGRRFEHWLNEQLEGACFQDLKLNLSVVATDVRSGCPVIFNRATTPDLPVARAVLYSMSIPFLFPFHHYKDHILVDGSILAEDGLLRDWSGDLTPVVCFRIRERQAAFSHPVRRWLPLADYLFMLLRTFMTTISREHLSDTLWLNTVLIETDGISPLEFNMTSVQKENLYQLGYRTTCEILPMKMARRRQ